MKIQLTFSLLLFCFFGISQELHLPVHTQYLADNNFVLSPTFAGIGDNLRIRANGLTQWVGIKDAPKNMSLAGDMRIADRSGVGLYLYSDRNGNTRQSGAKVSFAHHLVLDKYEDQYLSFGISYNLNQFRIEIENFTGQDAAVVDDRRLTNHNVDVGVLYRVNGFYISATAANILDKNILQEFKKLHSTRWYSSGMLDQVINEQDFKKIKLINPYIIKLCSFSSC